MSDTSHPVFNDRYEVHSRIGRGGMADVFLARDRLLDRPVAVKVLFPEYATDPNFVERFRREAQSAANLTHPNIVGVYDWGRQGSTYFIVMEYVNGRSLADILRADGVIQPQRAADIAFDVAGALGFAHSSGVVHRDVKPGNILVNPAGSVKVADFGIARALNSAHEQDLTQAGAVMGTATYFSPEQAQGATPDPRSDLYSLGIVMYEMVSGRPPFAGDNPVAIAYKQVHEMPRRLRDVAPTVPADYEHIVMKLLAKSPANRYADGDALRVDLKRFRDGIPLVPVAPEVRPVAPVAPANPTISNQTSTPPPTPARGTEVVRMAPATQIQQRQAPPVTYVPARVSNDPLIAQRQAPMPANRPAPTGPAYDEEPSRTGWYIAAAIFVMALAAILTWFFTHTNDKPPSNGAQVTVPNLVGKSREEAENLLKDAKLYPDAVAQINEAFAVGTVFDQDPKAGLSVDPTSTVKYLFNPGATKKLVENFVGGTLDDAKKKLTPLGLIVTVKPVESADKPPGTVLAQDPAPGPVPAGSTVTLTVAQAKNQVSLPNLTGEDRDAAVSALTTLGVKPKVVEAASDTVEKGKVINTTPPQNTPVDKGSEVLINVSSGIGDAAVPKLTGLTQEEAFAKIQEAGFLVGAVGSKEVVLGTPEDGRVISQNPPEGAKAAKKSIITVTIGKGIAPTTTTTTLPPTTTTTLAPTTTTTTIPAAPSFTLATTVRKTTDVLFAETATMPAPGNYTWQIVITNTGNTTLTGITVVAPQVGTCAKSAFDLAPGIDVTYTCTSTAVPTGVLVNNVTATIGGSSAGTKPTPKSDGATATTT
jgi:eukaryotic-like serine/threonine-protein kinase